MLYTIFFHLKPPTTANNLPHVIWLCWVEGGMLGPSCSSNQMCCDIIHPLYLSVTSNGSKGCFHNPVYSVAGSCISFHWRYSELCVQQWVVSSLVTKRDISTREDRYNIHTLMAGLQDYAQLMLWFKCQQFILYCIPDFTSLHGFGQE